MSADNIPLASEVKKQEEEVVDVDQPEEERELTPEEKAEKEAIRTELVRKCRDYIQSYIERKAPGKIRYRANVLNMNDSYVFRFSPPAKRGQRTRYFSQVVINRDTDECRLEYFRPRRHDKSLWYFPIYYMMNGFTKNPERTFQALGLETVQNSLRTVFEAKGYQVQYLYNRQIGNVVCVSWNAGEAADAQGDAEAEPEEAEPEEAEPEAAPAPAPASLEPEEGVPVEN